MNRILPEESIKTGDTIITSGQDGIFDSGYIVGRVVDVLEVKSEPLKRAKLETIINLNKLETLFVISKGK